VAESSLLAIDRARVFVAERGSRFDRLFLATVLGEREVEDLARAIESGQDERGAIRRPADHGEESLEADVGSTVAALGYLEAVRRLDLPLVERAVAFLSASQRSDGSWCATEGDSEEERLVLTGAVCGILANAPCARDSVLRAASGFMESLWVAERRRSSAYDVAVAYLQVMTNFPTDLADQVLQHWGRQLERGYRAGKLDAVHAARVFVLCDVHALPGARIDSREAVAALLATQQEDGGWAGGAGADPRARIAATLDAVVALRWLVRNAG
jgi:hypothetical protein